MADEATQAVTEIEYRGAVLRIDQVQAAIDECFEDATRGQGDLADVSPDDLDRLHEGISLRWAGAGFQAQDVALIVALVNPAVNHVLASLWDEVILPRLRSRLGNDAVGREVRRTKHPKKR